MKRDLDAMTLEELEDLRDEYQVAVNAIQSKINNKRDQETDAPKI